MNDSASFKSLSDLVNAAAYQIGKETTAAMKYRGGIERWWQIAMSISAEGIGTGKGDLKVVPELPYTQLGVAGSADRMDIAWIAPESSSRNKSYLIELKALSKAQLDAGANDAGWAQQVTKDWVKLKNVEGAIVGGKADQFLGAVKMLTQAILHPDEASAMTLITNMGPYMEKASEKITKDTVGQIQKAAAMTMQKFGPFVIFYVPSGPLT
jgi:hypothetical protein